MKWGLIRKRSPKNLTLITTFKSHLAYNANNIHLPLVRSRFVSKNKGEQQDYRQNLNLFCYQVRLALDADIKDALKIDRSRRLL